MRLRIILLLSILFTVALSAPVNEKDEKDDSPTTTVEPVTEISTSEPEDVPTTVQPEIGKKCFRLYEQELFSAAPMLTVHEGWRLSFVISKTP